MVDKSHHYSIQGNLLINKITLTHEIISNNHLIEIALFPQTFLLLFLIGKHYISSYFFNR